MQRLEVSGAVRLIYKSLGVKGSNVCALSVIIVDWGCKWARHLLRMKGTHILKLMCVHIVTAVET